MYVKIQIYNALGAIEMAQRLRALASFAENPMPSGIFWNQSASVVQTYMQNVHIH